MILNHINDIAAVCAGHGIETAIISPGSRSAPLTLAFNQHPSIEVKVIADERSAAFIAIGIAQQQKKPVALICTSGSAVYNYAPAVAEAYYQEIPLLILSADRPPEWTNQYDGQTIQQSGIFGKHVKASYDFPVDANHSDSTWHANRIINESIIKAESLPKGPVHINIPLREPFYPNDQEKISFDEASRIITFPSVEHHLSKNEWDELAKNWNATQKRLLIIGQLEADESLTKVINTFASQTNTLVINDLIGNQHQVVGAIHNQDTFLQPDSIKKLKDLSPDLLITIGKSLISKNLKSFLRNNPSLTHWHVHPSSQVNDSLQHLTKWLPVQPKHFLSELSQRSTNSTSTGFNSMWRDLEMKTKKTTSSYLESCAFGEFQAVNICLKALPNTSQLHLANSMSVRYANLIGLSQDIEVFANRGTSGIDGSNGTAVGAALSQDKTVTLLTGDMAFLYDRNAFWHNYDLSNLRIIILNNHGGGIFRMIKGPQQQPDYEKLFETHQALSAENTVKDYGFAYHSCTALNDLSEILVSFFDESNNAKVLEIFSDSKLNAQIFKEFKHTT